MTTEAYRIEVQTTAECGYEPCRVQPWIDEHCALSGDGTSPLCATESGGVGAYFGIEETLPPREPDMEFLAAGFLLWAALAVGFGLGVLWWSLRERKK